MQNEVSSLKLITNILNEESKSLNLSPPPSSNTTNKWTATTVNNRYSSRTSIHPQSSSYETSRRRQYAGLVTNPYAALSNSQLTNDSTYSPGPEQQPRYSKKITLNHSNKHYWKKSTTEFRNNTQRLTNHNPQEANRNKEETRHIPTSVMNDVSNVNPTMKKEQQFSTTPNNVHKSAINNLRKTIKT